MKILLAMKVFTVQTLLDYGSKYNTVQRLNLLCGRITPQTFWGNIVRNFEEWDVLEKFWARRKACQQFNWNMLPLSVLGLLFKTVEQHKPESQSPREPANQANLWQKRTSKSSRRLCTKFKSSTMKMLLFVLIPAALSKTGIAVDL